LIAWNVKHIPIPRDYLLVPAAGFMYKSLKGGAGAPDEKGFFGGRVWWHNNRIIHSTLWFLAWLWYDREWMAELLLFLDVCIGLL